MRSKIEIQKEKLIELHYNQKKKIIEIAQIYNCSTATIQKLFRLHNIKTDRSINRSKNILGQTFGYLKVLYRLDNDKNGRSVWLCECICGSQHKCTGKELRNSHVKSCGCRNLGYNNVVPGYFFANVRARARLTKKEFAIDYEYICELFKKQNYKCALTGRNISFSNSKFEFEVLRTTTASLDRIDSSKGYVYGNVQWIHKDLQRIKSDYSQEDFFNLCKEVYLWGLENAFWSQEAVGSSGAISTDDY